MKIKSNPLGDQHKEIFSLVPDDWKYQCFLMMEGASLIVEWLLVLLVCISRLCGSVTFDAL